MTTQREPPAASEPVYSADMPGDESTFGVIHMRGGRYERRGLPLDAAAELHRYELLVVRVARSLYMSRHENRKRAPHVFSTSNLLRLTDIREGSVTPVLRRDDILSDGVLPTPVADYFENARKLINTTLARIANEDSLDPAFPHDCLADLGALGRSLREGESMVFAEAGDPGSEVALDPATRTRLQQLAQLERIDVETVLLGQITGLRSKPQQFDLVLFETGRTIVGTYVDPAMFAALDEFLDYADRAPAVAVSVLAQQELDGTITGIRDTYHVAAALPPDWSARIADLAQLAPGWLAENSVPPTESALQRAEQILLGCLDDGLDRPGIFPTESGGVLLEWSSPRSEIEIEIAADGRTTALWIPKTAEGGDERTFEHSDPVDDIVAFAVRYRNA